MLFHIIRRSFVNQKKAMALMIVSVAVGTAIAASLITISLEITGKVSKELRAFGANILIEPKVEGLADISGQERYLRQDDIIRAKTIFWRHNIVGIAPLLKTKAEIKSKDKYEQIDIIGTWFKKELPLPGEKNIFFAGIVTVSPWWQIKEQWPDSGEKVAVGISLSDKFGIRTGDSIWLDGKNFLVSGILETGGNEDNYVFMDMESLQELKGLKGRISRVLVSALTKPMDEFAYKDPETMSQLEYEKWYCTAYVTSISQQLQEVFQGSHAKPVWQVAETEGKILNRLELLMYFLTALTLIASALGVSTTMIISLLRRIEEIGFMKAIGADSKKIITIFLSEGLIIGFIGGICGYALSYRIAQYIGLEVFDTGLEQRAILLPVAIGSAIVISFIGTILPIKKALHIKPAIALKGTE